MSVPEWLKEGGSSSYPDGTIGADGKRNFVERTILNISRLIEETVFTERYAKREGLLQGIDPRIKLTSLLLIIITVSLVRYTKIIVGIYLFTLLLAHLSNIDLYFFVKRVWVFIPIFAGIIAFPSIFNIVTPGEPLLTFYGLTVTKPGLFGAILFVSRVATSVSLAVLLALTTTWTDLMKSLRSIKVPQIFVLVFAMAYRYIFLLLRMIQDMHFARRSRTIKSQGSREGQNWVGSRIGFLFIKSLKLSEDIHSAMISRGFRGKVETIEEFKTGARDYLWLGFTILLCLTALGISYV